jgi:RNA polymerase sigma-70 factor (ECF subfamily)
MGLADDRERFAAMYREHRARVLAYALRRVPEEDAQDVVAETFLVAWRRPEQVPARPLPWFLSVARKVISTKLRSDRRLRNLQARLEGVSTDPPHPDPAIAADERLRLAQAFRLLTEADREILMLLAWDGLSVREAASVLGCTPASCSVRLHRARRRLKAHLREDSGAPLRAPRNVPITEESK